MEKLKKILMIAGGVIFVAVAAVWIFASDLEHIEDTNGPDNYTLQQINDANIINMDVGALNYKESKDALSNTITYSSDKFTGVAEIYSNNIKGNRLDITVNHARVDSGNFRLVLLHKGEIVHEFRLNELMQTYTLKNPSGNVSLRIAGESADFQFDYHID